MQGCCARFFILRRQHMSKKILIGLIVVIGSPGMLWADSAQVISVIEPIVKDRTTFQIHSRESFSPNSMDEFQAIRTALDNNLALKALFERFGVEQADILEESL